MTLRFNSFRSQLILLFGGLGLLIALPVFIYIQHVLSRQLVEAQGKIILDVASYTSTALAENLDERNREIFLLSQTFLFKKYDLDNPEVKDAIKRLQDTYPNYSWIGVTDVKGVVLSATKDLLVNVNVSKRPWFAHGSKGSFVGDVHEAVLLAKLLPPSNSSSPIRFIDFAAPIYDGNGQFKGVLGSHVHWRWSDDIIKRIQPKNKNTDGLEIFIVNETGTIIYPEKSALEGIPIPSNLLKETDYYTGEWSNDKQYVLASAPVKGNPLIDKLGWKVVVRQPNDVALQPVIVLQKTFSIIGFFSLIIFVALVVRSAATLSSPIEKLALYARHVEQGEEDKPLKIESSIAEISHLIDTLRGMTNTLISRRREVMNMNQTLEQKVRERTAELEEANVTLERLARRDALTELDNRLSANERLHLEWLRMKRSQRSYGVLLIDIDYFKRINDTYGHEAGDTVLKQVAQTLKNSLRITDFIARFGGEEFLVLLPEVNKIDAVKIAEKTRQTVENLRIERIGSITISIGATIASETDGNEETAIKIADDLLYTAKNDGRNRVAY